eukprot:Selendium_serpulae@DN10040_c0_g1_i1.p1
MDLLRMEFPECGKISKSMPLRYEKTKFCPYLRLGRCNKSTRCKYAHSESELVPLPDLRKTSLCEEFVQGLCKKPNCKFAHGLGELRCTSDVYKTSICIKFTRGYCSAGDSCRWAHGLSDLRPRSRARCLVDEEADVADVATPPTPTSLHTAETPLCDLTPLMTMTAQLNALKLEESLEEQLGKYEELGKELGKYEDLGKELGNYEDLGKELGNYEDLGKELSNYEDLGKCEDLG